MPKPLLEIAVNNTRARMRSKDRRILRDVEKDFTYFVKTAPYHPAFKKYRRDVRAGVFPPGGWNGMTSLYDKSDDSFPAGLIDRVVDLAEGYEITYYDRRKFPPEHPKLKDGKFIGDPREWQKGAFEASRQHARGVFEAATGAGKTNLMAQIILDKARPTLVLVNRNTLAKQTVERFRSLMKFPHVKDPFGIIGDGVWDPGLITVGTYQTLFSELSADPEGTKEFLRQFTCLHVDEAHHEVARTFNNLTSAIEGSYFRYGYSATPFKNDKETELKLVGACGEIIYSYRLNQAITDGVLATPRIYFVKGNFKRLPNHDPLDDKYQGTFNEEYKLGIATHIERAHAAADIANFLIDREIPTLILVQHEAHGKLLRRLIDGSEFIYGKHDTTQREEAKEQLASGELPVLIASSIFNEGEDIPAVGALINAGGYKADHLALQKLGRALRLSKSKSGVLVFDFWDSHSEHLEKHSKNRFSAYENEGLDVNKIELEKLLKQMRKDSFYD